MSDAPSQRLNTEGKDSPSYSIFGRLKIPCGKGELYLNRLRIFQTPLFGVFLHRIYEADSDKHLHDHPWPFLSILLWGFYVEEVPADVHEPQDPDGLTRKVIVWFNRKRATDRHRIVLISRSPIWTLVFVGRRSRKWGFHTENGWIESSEYRKHLAEQKA